MGSQLAQLVRVGAGCPDEERDLRGHRPASQPHPFVLTSHEGAAIPTCCHKEGALPHYLCRSPGDSPGTALVAGESGWSHHGRERSIPQMLSDSRQCTCGRARRAGVPSGPPSAPRGEHAEGSRGAAAALGAGFEMVNKTRPHGSPVGQTQPRGQRELWPPPGERGRSRGCHLPPLTRPLAF